MLIYFSKIHNYLNILFTRLKKEASREASIYLLRVDFPEEADEDVPDDDLDDEVFDEDDFTLPPEELLLP